MSDTAKLEKVVHAQSDELWNVAALLDTAVKAIALHPELKGTYISRIVRMAHDKVLSVQDEFQPFI